MIANQKVTNKDGYLVTEICLRSGIPKMLTLKH